MAPNVIHASREALEARREELLKRAGMPLEELRRRRENYSLVGEQWEITTELEEIDFLLGG